MNVLPDSLRRIPLAHRGLHDIAGGRPENSRAGIRAAIAAGYGIEIDLQLSRDRRAMVFHDDMLDRLTAKKGLVCEHEAADLSRIALKGGDEGIPEFAEVLALIAGRVPLLVELKDQEGHLGETSGGLEAAAADCLKGYEGPVAVMSFNPHMVARMAILAPDLPRGLVTCGYTAQDWPFLSSGLRDRLRDIPDYARCGAVFVSHDIADLERPRLAELRGEGAALLCWTVRSVEAEAKAREVADNITFEKYLPAIPS